MARSTGCSQSRWRDRDATCSPRRALSSSIVRSRTCRTPIPATRIRGFSTGSWEVEGAMHTLAFIEPGHFHAALTIAERHPAVRDDIFVYAAEGPELDDFLALIARFNGRATRPTAWRPVVRAGDRALARFLDERPGDVA